MRFPFVRALIFSFLCSPLGVSEVGGRATVKVENAAVYSQRSASAEVVKSLKKGDTVVVEMALVSGDGEWCSVREPDQETSLGYMRCEHLEREQRRPPVIIAPEPAAPSETPQTPPVAGRARPTPRDLAVEVGEDYVRPMRDWATAFHFTVEQQAKVDDLANSTGVTDCRRQHEAHYRTYARELAMGEAVVLPRQFTPAELQRIQNMVRDLNRFLYPCQVKMLELLERYPGLMTPEQQSNAQALAPFRKLLAGHRRGLTSPDMSHRIR